MSHDIRSTYFRCLYRTNLPIGSLPGRKAIQTISREQNTKGIAVNNRDIPAPFPIGTLKSGESNLLSQFGIFLLSHFSQPSNRVIKR